MKKIMICLTALLVLTACNKKSDNNQATDNNAAQTEVTTGGAESQ